MPSMKRSYAWLDRDFGPLLPNIATRLQAVKFDLNSDWQTLAAHAADPFILEVEILRRREHQHLDFDDLKGVAVSHKGYQYRKLLFEINAHGGYIASPHALRDIAAFYYERVGPLVDPSAALRPLVVDLSAWGKAFLETTDTAQLGAIVLGDLYVEPRMLGRYTAKTVDNRLHDLLTEQSGKIKSLRLSYYHEGVRRSAEARTDGVLQCSSQDEDDLESFALDMQQLYLRIAKPALAQES